MAAHEMMIQCSEVTDSPCDSLSQGGNEEEEGGPAHSSSSPAGWSWSQELALMVLVGLFQLRIFQDFDSVVSSEHRNAKEECCHGN